jgi:hypothetical protein
LNKHNRLSEGQFAIPMKLLTEQMPSAGSGSGSATISDMSYLYTALRLNGFRCDEGILTQAVPFYEHLFDLVRLELGREDVIAYLACMKALVKASGSEHLMKDIMLYENPVDAAESVAHKSVGFLQLLWDRPIDGAILAGFALLNIGATVLGTIMSAFYPAQIFYWEAAGKVVHVATFPLAKLTSAPLQRRIVDLMHNIHHYTVEILHLAGLVQAYNKASGRWPICYVDSSCRYPSSVETLCQQFKRDLIKDDLSATLKVWKNWERQLTCQNLTGVTVAQCIGGWAGAFRNQGAVYRCRNPFSIDSTTRHLKEEPLHAGYTIARWTPDTGH